MDNKSGNSEKVRLLTQMEWHLLFNLIPRIEATEKFAETEEAKKEGDGGEGALYFQPAEIVGDFIDAVISLDLVPGWNWVEWDEGDDILCDPENFGRQKIITLCKLLIMTIMADEFDEGFLVSNFEDGTILKILKALKKKVG